MTARPTGASPTPSLTGRSPSTAWRSDPICRRRGPAGRLRTGTGRSVGQTRRMLETSARLLRLLSLLGARRDWSGAELSSRLEISERTLRRDMERLRTLGYPVASSTGTAGGYRL